jgi:hypothetical protein
MSAATATALRPDAAEIGLAVINRVIPTYARGMHAAATPTLTHEAARLDGLPKSPVIGSMRAIVDSELTWRRHLARLGGRA